MEINLDPNIGQIGPLLLTWHGIFTAVGLLAGVWLAGHLAPRRELRSDDVYNIALYCVVGGIAGARVLFVLEHLDLYANNFLGVFAVYEGGISVWGAVVGGVLGGWLGTRIHRLSFGRMADIIAGPLIFGQGLGRIGDVINGEHHGTPTDLPFGVIYTNPNTLGVSGQQVHLAVGYEMIWDLIAAYVLIRLLARRLPAGSVFLWYVIIYSVGRFFTTMLRLDSPPFLLDLGAPTVFSIVAVLIAGPLLLVLRRRAETPESRQQIRARRRREGRDSS